MGVVFFRRKPAASVSIDDVFNAVREQVLKEIECRDYTLPFANTGVINRLGNMWFAWKNRGQVNHIIGDVHYLGIILPRKNTILTVHDCGELQKQTGIKKFILWLLWFYWPVKRLQYITTVSFSTKQVLLQHVKTDKRKIEVIYNGLLGEYKKKTNAFNKAQPHILQIGDTPNKNLYRIIIALENLNCKLVILGKPCINQIHFLKQKKINYIVNSNLPRNQVNDLYLSCDLLLYPSTLEGFGLPIIEAQASGLPVITSNIGAMREVASDSACLVDPFNTDSIRGGVIKVITDNNYRNSLIQKGLININKFSSESMAEGYLKLYKHVLLVGKVKKALINKGKPDYDLP